jgi:hypothetical protein
MEDIKRVISFDSVEEFWGSVILAHETNDDWLTLLLLGCTITSSRHHSFLKRPTITCSRYGITPLWLLNAV